jgi:hypothetical protein
MMKNIYELLSHAFFALFAFLIAAQVWAMFNAEDYWLFQIFRWCIVLASNPKLAIENSLDLFSPMAKSIGHILPIIIVYLVAKSFSKMSKSND